MNKFCIPLLYSPISYKQTSCKHGCSYSAGVITEAGIQAVRSRIRRILNIVFVQASVTTGINFVPAD